MARPRKSPLDHRIVTLKTLVTPAEFMQTVQPRLKVSGLNRSDYVRCAVMGSKIIVKQNTAPDFATRHELSRIGNNLNQIARKMNNRHPALPQLDHLLFDLETLFDRWLADDTENR